MLPLTLPWLAASLHLVALGLGLGAIWVRARRLRGPLDTVTIKRMFVADNVWALAAVLWIGTGLWRVLGGLEKGTVFYMHNAFFHAKMGVLALVLGLEVWPMMTFIRWRIRIGRLQEVDTSRASTFATISYVQAVLVVVMVFLATAMARGLGAF
jgi:putative membrane protein